MYSPRVEGVHLRFGHRRPRRAALVGPPGGLPHRDPRPGQGAGGEERRHRAGRREGRVRRQGPASADRRCRRRPRRAAHRGRGLLPAVHLGAARRHRQRRQGHGRCGDSARRGAPRRRRRLSGGRRGQGHRDLLRHRQRGRPVLRLLARRRLRLGRVGGLRPQGDGHHRQGCVGIASNGTSARWASTPSPRTSPSSVSAT